MSTIIEDGQGSGIKAKVNKKGRLETETITFRREDDAINEGLGYQITSGQVSFTTGGVASGILYFKNEEEADCVLDRVVLMIGSGDTSGDWYHRIIRNPESGTLLTDKVPCGISNSNHGSANVLNNGENLFKGSEGSTVINGTGVPLPIQAQSNRIVFPIGRRIPRGSSFAIEVTAPTINSGSVIAVSVAHVFLDEQN